MTGCPNGCARSSMSEIGFIGKGPGKYQLNFGGNEASTRLNRPYKEAVKNEDIVNELRPVLRAFRQGAHRAENVSAISASGSSWKELPPAAHHH